MHFATASRERLWDVLAMVFILVAMVRIATTFRVFSATADEPMHVVAGLEIFAEHRYGYQLNNPPLPRVILTFAAWRAGMKFDPELGIVEQLQGVFHTGSGNYRRNVVLVRAPNLLFFLIAAAATWFWARRELGPPSAALTSLLFTTQPMVLGHFGLATHEGASVAGVAVAVLAFSMWLDRPTPRRAAVAGAAYGFAICCKYSNVPFVPAVWIAMYIVRAIVENKDRPLPLAEEGPPFDSAQGRLRGGEGPRGIRELDTLLRSLAIAAVMTAVVIWAGFGFHVAVPSIYPKDDNVVSRALAVLERNAVPVLAPHFFAGLATILEVDRLGHAAYLLGEQRLRGWWYYFPLAVSLKTTLATLFLFLAGFATTRGNHEARRVVVTAVLSALAILAVAMSGHLDVGVRYVLPLYVPMSVAAAVGLRSLFASGLQWPRIIAVVLLGWHLAVSSIAHPDYFPYFNELAGRDPSRVLVDSNLDWGQDVLRLRDFLRKEGITSIGLHLMGPHDYVALGFPPHHFVNPWAPTSGYVAVSDHALRMIEADGGWKWLEGRSYRRIGTSIRVYEIH